LAAEREALWAKWKSGLESPETEKQQEERQKAEQAAQEAARANLKAATVNMSAVAVAEALKAAPASTPAPVPEVERRQNAERRAAPRDTIERRVAGRSWTVGTPAETEKRQQELEAERQREARRLETISEKSRAAAMAWGMGSAITFFVVSFGILLVLLGTLSSGSQNLVNNGDFSRQLVGWGSPATATVVQAKAGTFNRALRATVQPLANSNPWDITLRQDIASPLSQGSPITLRFWARSPESLPFSAALTENSPSTTSR
jgi:hypothetical protein